jgi:transcriptional regulator with XRE-family HTH domain
VPPHAKVLARRLGRRIADLRGEHGLTQEKLAWEIGLSSKGYLSRIEAGARLPSLAVLARIAVRLEVDLRDLFLFPDQGDVAAAMEAVRLAGPAFARKVIKQTRDRPRSSDDPGPT